MQRLFTVLIMLTLLSLPALAQNEPAADTGVTVTEVTRIDRWTGPGNTSAHLSPDGQRILHIDGDTFCVLTVAGKEEACYTLSEQTGLHRAQVAPDHDTVTWSPDSRFVAYTGEGWTRGQDMDIWLFAANTGQLTNLTDDGYDGPILARADIPEGVMIDYAPAWMPDGTLTFARNSAANLRVPTELWSLRLGDTEPVKVAELHPDEDEIGTVMSMEWSADGATLAYTLYHSGDKSGLWLYDAASGQTEFLLPDVRQERGNAIRATFSPDASQILLLTSEREQFVTHRDRDGHFVVSVETGEFVRLDPEIWVMSAGWLPDGSGLIYSGRSAQYTDQGVYVSADPSQAGRLALSGTLGEDEGPYNVYAPTNRVRSALKVSPDGTMLLGTSRAQALIVVQVDGLGPIPVQAQNAPEAQATDLPLVTDIPRVTVAPSITETPVPEANAAPGPVSVRELARLEVVSGLLMGASYLPPDGETLIHIQDDTACEYTLAGEELWCVEMVHQMGEDSTRLRLDPESVTISPDGRYLAFAQEALMTYRDPDIWVLDLETQEYRNLTEDDYVGSMAFSDKIPADLPIDLAPAWRPDGMLTFARHRNPFGSTIPSLWMVDPAGGEPEMLSSFTGIPGNMNLVMSMDWSPDGTRMTFVLDHMRNRLGGLWVYEADNDKMRPLVIPPEDEPGFLRADYSPDGESILLMTALRDYGLTRGLNEVPEKTGYFVVSAETGRVTPVTSDKLIMSIGWLPDGRLLYAGHVPAAPETGGLFVVPAEGGDSVKVMDMMEHEGELLRVLAPTPRQWAPIKITANGRFVLGSVSDLTPVLEAVTE